MNILGFSPTSTYFKFCWKNILLQQLQAWESHAINKTNTYIHDHPEQEITVLSEHRAAWVVQTEGLGRRLINLDGPVTLTQPGLVESLRQTYMKSLQKMKQVWS